MPVFAAYCSWCLLSNCMDGYMRPQVNNFTLFVYIGLFWCVVATIYATGQYFALSKSEITIQALNPGRDIILEKIIGLPEGKNKTELILNELRHRNEQITTLQAILESTNFDAKDRVIDEILLWLGVTVIFIILAVKFKGLLALNREEE